MENRPLILHINNQCSIVQHKIAEHYEDSCNKELLVELEGLKLLLDSFLSEKLKPDSAPV